MCLTIISKLLFDLAEVRPAHNSHPNPSLQLLQELGHVWSHPLKQHTHTGRLRQQQIQQQDKTVISHHHNRHSDFALWCFSGAQANFNPFMKQGLCFFTISLQTHTCMYRGWESPEAPRYNIITAKSYTAIFSLF